MKILAISDTHLKHNELDLPEADMIIHAGDSLIDGTKEEFEDFLQWYDKLPYKTKIYVAGNHDNFVESNPNCFDGTSITYLFDNSITINNLKIYGSPYRVVPRDRLINKSSSKLRWSAFMVDEVWANHVWNDIPNNLDILVTHMPPYKIRDYTVDNEGNVTNWGSAALLDAINKKRPRLSIFGHIHNPPGVSISKNTTFVNVAVCDDKYLPRQNFHVFDWL